jgi:protease IV
MSRRLTVVGLTLVTYFAVAGLFIAFGSALARGGGDGLGFGPRVAVVQIEGTIQDVDDLLHDLRTYRENATVRAVVVRIDSPGGVVGPTQELYQALRRIRAAGKPVVASLGAVAASGGYYVAVGADRIWANPGTLTGSIGVIMQTANVETLLKKVGVDYVVVKAGQYKDVGNFARPMTSEERRVLQAMLDDVHAQFIAAVAEGRKLERAQVLPFADGRIVSGSQAKDLRMVDALGGLEDAVNQAAQLAGLPVPPRVILPRKRFSVSDLLQSRLGLGPTSVFGGALPRFRTPLYLMD